jgi:hypothetical protein
MAGIRFPAEAGNFLLVIASNPAQGFTKFPIQWAPELKLPDSEAKNSLPFNAEVKNV